MHRHLPFITFSALAGLAGALIALWLLQGSEPVQTPAITYPASGPVSYADAVNRAQPSVVNIFTTKVTIQRTNSLFDDPFFRRFFGDNLRSEPRERVQNSLGSGVIIDQQHILTNHHVVADADEIKVVLANGQTVQARLAGTDPETDIAVLVTNEDDLPAITIGDSEKLRVGDVVLAIGNPFGVGQTVTMGIVGAKGRDQLGINTFENFIQTDAAINPGNSGGALINAQGELVGINTAIFSKSGGSQGIGFAIPASLARGVLTHILEHGKVIRGWIGVAGQNMNEALAESFDLDSVQGVLVSGILDGGAADLAGIKPGDIIIQIEDHSVTDTQQLIDYVARLAPGTEITIRGIRDGVKFKTTAKVQERPNRVGKG
ncbi:MAG: trypsin-like serine protease [Gammaproteobacteria bacterium]|nr:trypsin-like serine protease [Gammaproteobacteria bacterium]